MSAPARDAGRVSVFMAVIITGLLLVFGVAVDGTGQLRTLMRAENIAAEAARAAGQAIDPDVVASVGEHRVNAAKAAQFASEYLAAAGHDLPGSCCDVQPNAAGTAVDISVTLPYDRRIVDLFGFSDTIPVTGTATAVLVTGP
jgi:Flp pilus assembly protein TadG